MGVSSQGLARPSLLASSVSGGCVLCLRESGVFLSNYGLSSGVLLLQQHTLAPCTGSRPCCLILVDTVLDDGGRIAGLDVSFVQKVLGQSLRCTIALFFSFESLLTLVHLHGLDN